MGNAYDAKGDRNRAVAAYKRAEALGDNYDNAQDAIKTLYGDAVRSKGRFKNDRSEIGLGNLSE